LRTSILVAGLGGIHDEGAKSGGGGRQPATDASRAGAHRTGEIARERVVAAGIENDDAGLALAIDLHLAEYEIELHGLELQVAFAFEFGVGGHEVVLRADLQPVAGVEKQRDIGGCELVGEAAQCAIEFRFVGIEGLDHVKPGALEGGSHVASVVQRVGERRRVDIGVVADDEGNAVFHSVQGRTPTQAYYSERNSQNSEHGGPRMGPSRDGTLMGSCWLIEAVLRPTGRFVTALYLTLRVRALSQTGSVSVPLRNIEHQCRVTKTSPGSPD
jgi:hypothetical protein